MFSGCIFDRLLIDVPYRSQEDSDARNYRNDCGPACAAMLLAKAGINLSIDALSAQTTLRNIDNGLACWQVAALLRRNGLQAVSKQLQLSDIISELNAARTPIALINYGCIPGRQNVSDRAGHFVVVVGYSPESIYIHDPDFWGARRSEGRNFEVSRADFDAALRSSPAPFWCITP